LVLFFEKGCDNFVSIDTGETVFSLLKNTQTGSGAHSTSYRMSTGIISPGIKRPGCEFDQIGLEEPIIKEIEQNQLTWYGHVQRMAEGKLPKIALKWMPKQRDHEEDRRKTGWNV